MAQDNEDFLLEDFDDDAAIEFVKNYLPQDLKEKFSRDEMIYFFDLIDEYYYESGVLEANPDKDGYIEIDLDPLVDFIIKEAKKDGIGEYEPDEILLFVQGEMAYTDELEENEGK